MPTMTASKLYDVLRPLYVFKQFAATTDETTARQLAINAYSQVFCGRYYLPSVNLPQEAINKLMQQVSNTFRDETQKFIRNKAHINRLRDRALRHEFFTALRHPGNRKFPTNVSMAPLGRDPRIKAPIDVFPDFRTINIEEGLDWVLGCSTTDPARGLGIRGDAITPEQAQLVATEKQMVVQGMRHIMNRVVRDQLDVLDVQTLITIQRSAGPVATATDFRYAGGGSSTQFYGGTAMGTYLLKYVANQARMISNMSGSPLRWYDIAAFQLASNIVAHGFADANGRSARMLFACTLVQKGLPFLAPAYDWVQNQIHDRNVHDVVFPTFAAQDAQYEAAIDALL